MKLQNLFLFCLCLNNFLDLVKIVDVFERILLGIIWNTWNSYYNIYLYILITQKSEYKVANKMFVKDIFQFLQLYKKREQKVISF